MKEAQPSEDKRLSGNFRMKDLFTPALWACKSFQTLSHWDIFLAKSAGSWWADTERKLKQRYDPTLNLHNPAVWWYSKEISHWADQYDQWQYAWCTLSRKCSIGNLCKHRLYILSLKDQRSFHVNCIQCNVWRNTAFSRKTWTQISVVLKV